MPKKSSYNPIYASPPVELIDGIPVYSNTEDRYVKNYQRIASDHVAATKSGIDNPFIETDIWRQLEASTRELVEQHISPRTRVLDVGVGMGHVLASFNELQRYGIDISFDYLKVARASGIEAVFSRIEDMPYRDGIFDAILACDVLEHVIDLHACCRQILRVLKPRGTLIVRVPYLDDLDAYIDDSSPYEFIHLRNFDVAGLRLLFEKVFGCKYVEHTFVAPYLKGPPRLKIRQLKANSPVLKLMTTIPDRGHPLSVLKHATAVTEEEFINWIYALKANNPALFSEVADELIYGLEVNIVFRKGDEL